MRPSAGRLFREALRLAKEERLTTGGIINLVGLVLASAIAFSVSAASILGMALRSLEFEMGQVRLAVGGDPAVDVLVMLIMFVVLILYSLVCAFMYDGYTLIRRSRRRPEG